MQAEIVGIKRLDFVGRDNKPVKKTMWYVKFAADNVEGHETGYVSWDELAKRQAAPEFTPGEVVEINYNKYGKLHLVEQLQRAGSK